MPKELLIEHAQYLQDEGYRRRVDASYARAARTSQLSRALVVHDQACCDREPWSITARRLRSAVAAQAGRPVVLLDYRDPEQEPPDAA